MHAGQRNHNKLDVTGNLLVPGLNLPIDDVNIALVPVLIPDQGQESFIRGSPWSPSGQFQESAWSRSSVWPTAEVIRIILRDCLIAIAHEKF